MHESPSEHASPEPPPLGHLLGNALHHAQALFQAELSLARSECTSEVSSALRSIGLLVAGAALVQAALTALCVFLVLAFGAGVGAIVLIGVVAGLGLVLCLLAKRALQMQKLPRTSARLALDAQQVMEMVK